MISQSLSTSAIPGEPGTLSGHLGGPVTRQGAERTDIDYRVVRLSSRLRVQCRMGRLRQLTLIFRRTAF
jgi:hypothetical protein